jgi:hypothetical protein
VAGYEYLRAELALAAPASAESVARLREEFGPQVPEDFLTFLSAHDGAEGAVGVLTPAVEVGRGADLYPALDHLHDLVIFGSDGGGEAFAFDPGGQVVVVPWIGGTEDAIPQGTFNEFLSRLVGGTLFEQRS